MARVGPRAKIESRHFPKSMRQNLDLVRSLAKPDHTWWFVYIYGKYMGNIPGKHYAGAVKRAAKVYAPDLELTPSDLEPPKFPKRANDAWTAEDRNRNIKITVVPYATKTR